MPTVKKMKVKYALLENASDQILLATVLTFSSALTTVIASRHLVSIVTASDALFATDWSLLINQNLPNRARSVFDSSILSLTTDLLIFATQNFFFNQNLYITVTNYNFFTSSFNN